MVQAKRSTILAETEDFVELHFRQKVSANHVYHNVQHVQNVVEAARRIARYYDLNEEDYEVLEIAAWFHDTGFHDGSEGHEERSVELAEFLRARNYDEHKILRITQAILGTKFDSQPTNLTAQILRDADLSHLGSVNYGKTVGKCGKNLLLRRVELCPKKSGLILNCLLWKRKRSLTDITRTCSRKKKRSTLVN